MGEAVEKTQATFRRLLGEFFDLHARPGDKRRFALGGNAFFPVAENLILADALELFGQALIARAGRPKGFQPGSLRMKADLAARSGFPVARTLHRLAFP